MLASEFIRSLPHVDWLKLVLSPEAEQFFRDAKTGSDVVDRHGLSIAESLQDGLQVLLWFKLLVLELLLAELNLRRGLWLELLLFVGQILVGICELAFVIFDQEVHSSRTISFPVGRWMGCDSHDSDAVQLCKVVILKLLGHGPWDQIS